jgi:PhzF family phenazine biosynthesis protein
MRPALLFARRALCTMPAVPVPLFQIDAFASAPFAGNPAAVCLLPAGVRPSDPTLLQIAAEMNLSETAFLEALPEKTSEETDSADAFRTASRFRLRWFTPKCEVALCGHATMASASALLYHAGNVNDRVEFETTMGMGDLSAERAGDGRVLMELPLNPVDKDRVPYDDANGFVMRLARACGGAELASRVADVRYSSRTRKLLIRLDDAFTRADLEALEPDAAEMLRVQFPRDDARVKGLILTTTGDDGLHFVSRYFAPWVGIDEDPVTGSAHTVSAPYWAEQLGISEGSEMRARQCSPRGGDLMLTIRAGRLSVVGDTALVLAGRLMLPA